MNKERKAPKDWKTWEDFANCYDLVLFNQCVNIENSDVLERLYESYTWDDSEDPEHENMSEVFQWYAISASEWDVEYLNKHFNLDIFYSDMFGMYILPVYHYGTSWDYVSLSMNDNEN